MPHPCCRCHTHAVRPDSRSRLPASKKGDHITSERPTFGPMDTSPSGMQTYFECGGRHQIFQIVSLQHTAFHTRYPLCVQAGKFNVEYTQRGGGAEEAGEPSSETPYWGWYAGVGSTRRPQSARLWFTDHRLRKQVCDNGRGCDM